MEPIVLCGPNGDYQIGKKVAETGEFRLYICRQAATNRECLLQIAIDVSGNGALDKAVYVLGELKTRADELQAEYQALPGKASKFLNYELGFPEVLDSFVCKEQGNRRVNILAFRGVESVGQMVPLVNLIERDKLRVDLRTSVWIMGKLLKLLVFVHDQNLVVNTISLSNVLIEPAEHYVVIFDWSKAAFHSGLLPAENKRQEIAQAAQAVFALLGGDPETGDVPRGDEDEEIFTRYTAYVRQLAVRGECDAPKAHADFYRLVDELWKREFYFFTTKPLL